MQSDGLVLTCIDKQQTLTTQTSQSADGFHHGHLQVSAMNFADYVSIICTGPVKAVNPGG
jgi:hypothetical protein